MTSAYSTGESIFAPRMVRHSATTFDGFVSAISTPVVLSCKRAEYWALPRDQQLSIKAIRFFTAACYPRPENAAESAVQKTGTEPESFGLVCVDIDQPEAAANWVGDDVAARLPWAHFVYHTTSSRPEAPRVRVVVGVEQLPISEHARVAAFILEYMHVPANPESTSPLQAMFMPTVFKDEVSNSPTISRVTTAPLLTLAETPELNEAAKQYGSSRGIDDPPLAGVDMSHAEDMLRYVSPDCTYGEWCAVCCGLQHQFAQTGETEAAAAFQLFDRWSSGSLNLSECDKYEGEAATYKKWRAFSAFGKRSSITIRSLIAKAKTLGWTTAFVTTAAHDSFKARLDECVTKMDAAYVEMSLMPEIATHELLSDWDRSSLANYVVRSMNLMGRSLNVRVVTKLMSDHAAKARREVKPDSNWCGSWAYVAEQDKWYNLAVADNTAMVAVAFDAYNINRDKGDEARHCVYALKNGAINALQTVYVPTTAERVVKLGASDLALNTYQASYPSADPTKSDAAGEIFDAHMAKLFRDENSRRTLKDWIAWVLQNPGDKAMWAPVIQGTFGCGKSVIFAAMGACLGNGNFRVITNEYLNSAFNDWAEDSQLLVFEEVQLAGREAKKLKDKLKLLVTSTVLPRNKRFCDAKEVKSYGNCAFVLNNLADFPMDADERRYFVLRCAQQRTEDKEGMDREYWNKVYTLTTTLAGGLRHHLLMHRCAEGFNALGEAPKTLDMFTASLASAHPDELNIRAAWHRNPCIREDAVIQSVVEALLGTERGSSAMSALMTLGYTAGPRITRNGSPDMIWYRATMVSDVSALEASFPKPVDHIANVVSMFDAPPELDTPIPDLSKLNG